MEEVKSIDNEVNNNEKKKKKKSGIRRYIIYFSFVLIATGIALFLSLYKDFNGVVKAFENVQWKWIGIIAGVVAFTFVLDGLVITIFMRLYSHKYKLHQGVATSLVGNFYCAVTPGASGGQVMQAYTLNKQGCPISNAASLLVMYTILYQFSLITFDIITVSFKWNLLSSIGGININGFVITIVPLTIIGFLLNILVMAVTIFMSYSRGFHNLIMHYGIGFLAKIKILKKPDKTRENLRIQIENFKIELKRLMSNIPITILIVVIITFNLMVRFSIPWFAGMALNGYGYYVNEAGNIVHTLGDASFKSVLDACFLSGYHQMVTGLIPIPGAAGVSEIFFSKLFCTYYNSSAVISASQILWRTMTFHVVLLITGLFSAFYKAKPSKEQAYTATRKTFITMQYETYEERKKTSDTLYKTSQINRKELQNKLKSMFKPNKEKDKKYILNDKEFEDTSPFNIEEEFEIKDKNKKDNWRDLDIK